MADIRYSLTISVEAREQLRTLPQDRRRQIGERLSALQVNLAGDVKKLAGVEGRYRLRVGKYRILFRLEKQVIEVYAVRDRKDAYE